MTKKQLQELSRKLVSSGKLKQTDLFLFSPAKARRAIVTLKA